MAKTLGHVSVIGANQEPYLATVAAQEERLGKPCEVEANWPIGRAYWELDNNHTSLTSERQGLNSPA